ncbi:MAG TPA: hypothetical protein VFF36_05985, partial [Planctomycetota bacterium]|nr:hypothetical protein [Planctomycetota bacterium]
MPELFRQLETTAAALESEQSTLFAWVREDLVPRTAQPEPEARAQLRGDHEAVQRVLVAFEAAADRGTGRLEQIGEALRASGRTDLIDAFPARREKAKAQLDGLRNTGRFRKQLRRVEAALDPSVPGAAASALLQVALGQVDGAFPAAGDASPSPSSTHAHAEADAGSAPPSRASAALEGATDLDRALAEVDGQVDAVFEAALAGFDAYPPALLRSGSLHALRLSVLDRKAEALFRLGRRREARTAWVALLRADPLCTAALRNVAVCETGAADRGGERSAWRAYAEILYVEAAAGDRPGRGAAERAALHRDYGGAMAAPDVLG